MSNSTFTSNSSFSNDYLTLGLGILLILSEVMPFIKKHKGNGLCDSIVCLLRGSSCLTKRLADTIEASQEAKSNDIELSVDNS